MHFGCLSRKNRCPMIFFGIVTAGKGLVSQESVQVCKPVELTKICIAFLDLCGEGKHI